MMHRFLHSVFALLLWLCSFLPFITRLYGDTLFTSFIFFPFHHQGFSEFWSDLLITSFVETKQQEMQNLKYETAFEMTEKL